MMNVKELKGIDVHLKEIDRLIQLSPTRTVDRSQIRNPKEIERHEQMKQYALRLGIIQNPVMTKIKKKHIYLLRGDRKFQKSLKES